MLLTTCFFDWYHENVDLLYVSTVNDWVTTESTNSCILGVPVPAPFEILSDIRRLDGQIVSRFNPLTLTTSGGECCNQFSFLAKYS